MGWCAKDALRSKGTQSSVAPTTAVEECFRECFRREVEVRNSHLLARNEPGNQEFSAAARQIVDFVCYRRVHAEVRQQIVSQPNIRGGLLTRVANDNRMRVNLRDLSIGRANGYSS